MSTREYNAFADHGLPTLASGKKPTRTAYLIFAHLCWRYDTRDNKLRAYPGMDELQRVTGASRTTCQDALDELVTEGLVWRVTRGRRGSRAEFVPIYAVQLLETCSLCKSESHSKARAKSKESSRPDIVSGVPEIVSGGASLVSGAPVTINTLDTNLNTSKYVNSKTIKDDVIKNNQPTKSAPKRINYERWQVVTAQIPSDVKRLINPGSNYELLLDDLVAQGWKLPVIADRVGRIRFSNAEKCGAILEHVLRELAGKPAPSRSGDKTPWCGSEGCDPVTRQWEYPSLRSDNTPTFNCLTCHPLELRTRPTYELPAEINDFITQFGKMDKDAHP